MGFILHTKLNNKFVNLKNRVMFLNGYFLQNFWVYRFKNLEIALNFLEFDILYISYCLENFIEDMGNII